MPKRGKRGGQTQRRRIRRTALVTDEAGYVRKRATPAAVKADTREANREDGNVRGKAQMRRRAVGRARCEHGKPKTRAAIGKGPCGQMPAKGGVILSGQALPAHRKTTTSGSKSYSRTVKISKKLLRS